MLVNLVVKVLFCVLCLYMEFIQAQNLFNRYKLMSRLQMKPRIRARLQEKLNQYKARTTQTVCYGEYIPKHFSTLNSFLRNHK